MNNKPQENEIDIKIGSITIKGLLNVPKSAKGVVLFAHGSGSTRFSPRNAIVAGALQQAGLATLLMDLLTEEEEQDRANVFDINLLASRLVETTNWVKKQPELSHLPIGYFGASTGAAAALNAAAETDVGAVVSRGGRPDLSIPHLPKVTAPTLLIVGGNDFGVIELNEQAYDALVSEKKMEIIPGATHLFEEPGALEEVAGLATRWFVKKLAK